MEHPVATKLRTVVKYLETGTLLTRLAPCRIHRVYRYTNEILAAVVALGLPPSLAIFSKALGGGNATSTTTNDNTAASPDLWHSLQELPSLLAWVSLVLIVIFVAAKIYVIQANTEKTLALAESNRNQFRNFSDDLESTILEKDEPMEALNELLGQIISLKKLCVTNDIYPWNPFPNDPDFLARCKQRSDDLIERFKDNWRPPPSNPGVRQTRVETPIPPTSDVPTRPPQRQ